MKNKQGWKVLIAASIFQLFLGVIYIWGIFVLPAAEAFGWEVEVVQLTSSFKIGFFVLGNFCGGKLQTKMCASKVSMLGGILLAGGVFVAAVTAPTFPVLFYLSYGIIGGFGAGMGYIVVITAAQKWFPNMRGLATGICVGAFGLSVTVLAPVLTWLLTFNPVQTVFLIMAATFFLASVLFGRVVKFPDEDSGETHRRLYTGEQFTTGEIIKKKEYYCLMLSLLLVTVAFFVINPSVQTLSIDRGFSVEFATTLLMMTGISNTLGRIIIPPIADKVGKEATLLSLMMILAFAAATLTFATGTLFILVVALVPICFGAGLAIIPLLVADYFGLRNFGSNYSAIGIGFATSALFMPGLISLLGDYRLRFIAVSVLSLCGVFTTLLLLLMAKRKPSSIFKK